MILSEKKSIGIIGGMGPMATVDLFHKIVSLTDANSDCEHIHIYVDCNPGIPDRTAALLHGGESPVPFIRDSANKLVAMGADILVLPCNTSHAYYQDIVDGIDAPLINMVEETVQYVNEKGITKVGLLATDGTVKSEVYEKAFRRNGVEVISPILNEQQIVMDMIYRGVKAGNIQPYVQPFCDVVLRMQSTGVRTFILGCTELPLVVCKLGIDGEFIDPSIILAKVAIKKAGYSVKDKGVGMYE